MLSIWEKNHWVSYDLVVVGGGIVGLSTAISWKENHPDDEVIVLERGTLPTGASTRNAGFACFGSLSELLSDISLLGKEGSLKLVEKRWKGLNVLRNRLGDKALQFEQHGGYELLRDQELHFLEKMDEVNDLLYPLFDKNVFHDLSGKISEFGFDKDTVHGMIFNPFEGQLDSGLMMKNLNRLAREKGIAIHTGTTVNKVDIHKAEVVISDPIRGEYLINGRKLALCTNAFTQDLLPDIELSPGRGMVMVTERLKDLPFKGTFHIDEGYYYFRDYDDRVMLGGGRNLDIKKETTTKFEINKKIYDHLEKLLYNVILPEQEPKIEMKWAGVMAFGANKSPVIKKLNDNCGVAVRLGGMGVAIGSLAGKELTELLSS